MPEFQNGDILFRSRGEFVSSRLAFFCSGYLVVRKKVLLVLHERLQMWVPPGGHVEANETFAEAAEREFREETGIDVSAISALPVVHESDDNSSSEPVPFHVDVVSEGMRKPSLGQYFYMQPKSSDLTIHVDKFESDDARWFARTEVTTLRTFEQVRSLASWAIEWHPNADAK